MKTVRSLFHRLYNLFHKEQLDRDLSDELAAHLEIHTADNVREGMGVGRSAAWGADTALGGVEETKESMRDRRSVPLLHWHGAECGTRTDPGCQARSWRKVVGPGGTVLAHLDLV